MTTSWRDFIAQILFIFLLLHCQITIAGQFKSIAEILNKIQSGELPTDPTLFPTQLGKRNNGDILQKPIDDAFSLFGGISTRHKVWMNSGKFQGDIDGVDPHLFFNDDAVSGLYYNAIRNKKMVWPNAIIPYFIAPEFSKWEKSIIQKALQTYHMKTCIKFVPRTWQRDYLYLTKGYGCYSQVGMTGGKQDLSLGRGCLYHEIIVHELMHCLGFWHEHSRADRDGFIKIVWPNISPGMRGQFDKISAAYQDLLGETYDYRSVMHYDSTAFSKNGQNTIKAVDSRFTRIIGTATDLSEIDLRKVNKLYKCPAIPRPPSPIPRPKSPMPRPPTPWTTRPTRRITPIPFTRFTTFRPITTTPRPRPLPPVPPPANKTCFDKFLDCPFFAAYCHKSNSFLVMKSYCPRTCGHCANGKQGKLGSRPKPETEFRSPPLFRRVRPWLFNGKR